MRVGFFVLVICAACGLAVADERVTPAVYIAPTQRQTPEAAASEKPQQLHALVSGFERNATPAALPPLPQSTATPAAAPVSPVVHAFTNNDLRQPSRPIQTVAQAASPTSPPLPILAPPQQLESTTPVAPSLLPTPLANAPQTAASDDILDTTFAGTAKSAASESSSSPRTPLVAGMPDVTKLVTVLGSLILVIGLFLLFSLFLKKVSPHATRTLPKEVFENLGRAALSPKIQLQLLRLGNRLVLVSVTVDGTSTVTEITDPDEVMQVLGMCRRLDATSSTIAFRNVLNGADTEHAPRATSPIKPHRANDSLASILAAGLVKS